MINAIFPGSFDPITNGHLNIIQRASRIFDKLTIIIANNTSKQPFFSVTERKQLIMNACRDCSNVDVLISNELVTRNAERLSATVIVRGLRNGLDLDYERPMAMINHNLNPEIETVYLPALPGLDYVASSRVKELFKFNGDVSKYVPQNVLVAMKKKRDEQD